MKTLTPFSVRSTLYMPATQKGLKEIITVQSKTNADAVVFCFEDALNLLDIPKGIDNLNQTFEDLIFDPALNQIVGQGTLPYRFIRVRSIENYHQLMQSLSRKVLAHIHGIVIPKFTLSNIQEWEKALKMSGFQVMPTLETEDYFDPAIVKAFFARLSVSSLKEQVLCLRLGGNDLLRGLSMRRPQHREFESNHFHPTLYDTPLSFVINNVMINARLTGFELSAPVFESFGADSLNAFTKELMQDRYQGFIGKTAIHPSQCTLINQAFKISKKEKQLAHRIIEDVRLNGNQGGVSQSEGTMIEPTTHYAWAKRLIGE